MRMRLKILLYFVLLSLVSCSKDNNLIFTDVGDKKLSINTERITYSWQQDESQDFIIIQGTLRNESNTVFYSRLGDGFGPLEQDQLHIARNSEGYIEKFSESANSWIEKDLGLYLIEGSKFVPLKPSQVYSIYSHLTKSRDAHESGKYRIRIDYFDIENPDSAAIPFRDYANIIEIK